MVAEQLSKRFARLHAVGTPLLLNAGWLLRLGFRWGCGLLLRLFFLNRLWLNRCNLSRIVRRRHKLCLHGLRVRLRARL